MHTYEIVASPAQATAAPMSIEPYEEGSSSNSFHSSDRRKSREPVVMLEPLKSTVSNYVKLYKV